MNSNLEFIRLFFMRVNVSHRPAFSWQGKSAKITDNHSSINYLILHHFKDFRFYLLAGFSIQVLFFWIYLAATHLSARLWKQSVA